MKEDISVRNINNLLNSAKTRIEGLKLLQSYLSQCSDEHFVEYCTNWMQSCCKLDVLAKNNAITIQVLNDLIKKSANYSQLNKNVSFFITNRFFDYFLKYHVNSKSGWSCLKTCFLLYKGPSGPFQEAIEKYLTLLLRKNEKISPTVAQCFSLLPSLGGGGHEGVIYQTNWKSQFEKFLQLCHSILNDLFVNVEEFREYYTGGELYKNPNVYFSPDQLIIQFYNHCNVLYFMLINKYPVQKYISPDPVLQLICRGLAVNSKSVQSSHTTINIGLQKALPEVHIILCSLLSALITACKNQLLPYYHVICKLIKQILEFAESIYFCETEKSHINLKISAYEVLCNWLAATKNGSCVETISKIIVSNAVGDIESRKQMVVLKDAKHRNPTECAVRRTDHVIDCELCCAALKALQFLIKFSGISLKVDEHKFLQESVIKLLVDVQKDLSYETDIYSVSTCRKELYALLLELVNQPCLNWPPPTHFALRIFSRGESDACPQVSQFCSASLSQLTNIIHPQFSSVTFLSPAEPTFNKNREELSTEIMNQPMGGEVVDRSLEDPKAVFTGSKNFEKENKTDKEKIAAQAVEIKEIVVEANTCSVSEESDVSSLEDSIKTVQFSKNAEEFTKESNNIIEKKRDFYVGLENVELNRKKLEEEKEEEEEPVRKKRRFSNEKSSTNDNIVVAATEQSPLLSEGKNSEIAVTKNNEPLMSSVKIKTPQIDLCNTPKKQVICLEENLSEDSISVKSVSPEFSTEEEKSADTKKRYFLRSKTCKTPLEESDGTGKKNNSSDSSLNTPKEGSMRSSSRIESLKRRPRTRASSRLETNESENESISPKKDEHDAFEEIMEAFDDSFVE